MFHGFVTATKLKAAKFAAFDFLEDYKKEKKISVLLASHNMEEVKRLCSSVLMMKDGLIVDRGTTEELITKYGRRNLEEVFLEIARK